MHKDHALKKYRIKYLEKESSVFILFIYMWLYFLSHFYYWHSKGELGGPYIFNKSQLTSEEKLEYETGWKKNNFNEFASNRISLQRSLKDPRDKE